MIVAHNLLAMNANGINKTNSKYKAKSTEKLASGYRINRAADDAAGLSISEKMRKQIRGLTQASDNCQDGVSFCQVADGALDEVQDILHRINQLSVKAANGTNSDDDRNAIDNEVQELKSEMQRIFVTTEFNERKIWEPENKIELEPTKRTVTHTYPAVTFPSFSSSTTITDDNKMAIPRSDLKVVADDDGMTVSWTGYNGKKYESDVIEWPDKLNGAHSFKLSDHVDYASNPEIEGIDFTYTYNVNSLSTKQDVIDAINNSYINYYESSGESIEFEYADPSVDNLISGIGLDIYYEAEIVSGKSYSSNDTTFASNEKIDNNPFAVNNNSETLQFSFDINNIRHATAKVDSAYFYGYGTSASEKDLWYYMIPNSSYKYTLSRTPDGFTGKDSASMDGIIEAIEDTGNGGDSLFYDNSSKNGYFHMNFSITNDSAYTGADGRTVAPNTNIGNMSLSLNMDSRSYATPGELEEAVRKSLANISGFDVRDNSPTSSSLQIYRSKDNSRNTVSETKDEIIKRNYLYLDDNGKNMGIQAGAESSDDNKIELSYDSLSLKKIGLEDTHTLTVEAATNAIDDISNALSIVSSQRSYFGAVQNRMEHTIKNIDNVVENTQSAESVIRDTDMAAEMVQMSKYNILEQAGISMMTQANQSNQGVMSLLQ